MNEVLDILLCKIQNILGEKLVGLYLYGSLATGDFNPNISDIDLLAVLKNDINDNEFKELQKMHSDFAGEYEEWNNRIEVQYISELALKTFKTKESDVAVISPGEPFHKRSVGKHWLINWYMVQEKGITLFGPSPKTIIDYISKEEFIQSNKDHVKNWNEWVGGMKNRKAQAYAILTMCRALYADRKGEHVSKTQAAEWAEKQLPAWSELIRRAIRWRKSPGVDEAEDQETYPETVKFVNVIREMILK